MNKFMIIKFYNRIWDIASNILA